MFPEVCARNADSLHKVCCGVEVCARIWCFVHKVAGGDGECPLGRRPNGQCTKLLEAMEEWHKKKLTFDMNPES